MEIKLEQLLKLKETKELELELINIEINRLNYFSEKNNDLLSDNNKVIPEKKSESFKEDLIRELKDFPRYLINGKKEIFHETGIQIPTIIENNKTYVELFNKENMKIKVDISKL